MKSQLAFLAVFACLQTSLAQDELCVKPPTLNTTLDLEAYTGNWYVYKEIPVAYQPSGTTCVSANYVSNPDVGEFGGVDARNTEILPNGLYNEVCGVAYQTDPVNAPGELIVELANYPPAPYWILDTDYVSFGAVYTCAVGDPLVDAQEIGWMFSRDPEPSIETINKMENAFSSRGIDLNKFEIVFQGNAAACIYDNPRGENCNAA